VRVVRDILSRDVLVFVAGMWIGAMAMTLIVVIA
jgi:hypothetical protein